jgi:hypothetical protein
MGARPRTRDMRRIVTRGGMVIAIVIGAVGLAACGGAADRMTGVGTAGNAAPSVAPAAVPAVLNGSGTEGPQPAETPLATGSTAATATTPDATPAATPAGTPAPTAPTVGPASLRPASAGTLPDLSGIATDLRAIDSMLAADASASTSEGSDK